MWVGKGHGLFLVDFIFKIKLESCAWKYRIQYIQQFYLFQISCLLIMNAPFLQEWTRKVWLTFIINVHFVLHSRENMKIICSKKKHAIMVESKNCITYFKSKNKNLCNFLSLFILLGTFFIHKAELWQPTPLLNWL